MKIKIMLITLVSLLFLVACENAENLYITNNVIEGTIYNIQSEVPGKIIYSGLQRGKRFRKGDTILVIDTTLIDNEKKIILANLEALKKKEAGFSAKKKSVAANMLYFKKQYEKWRKLALSQAGPEQRADDFKHQYDIARLQLKEINTQIEALPAERNILLAKLSSIRETVKKHIITAPVTGTVIDKYIEPGEIVSPGLPLAQMSDLTHIHVYFYWPIEMLGKFAVGDKVELYIEGSETPFEGQISWVSPVSEFTPKIVQSKENRAQLVYKVRVEAGNPEGKLKIGQPVEIRLPWKEQHD